MQRKFLKIFGLPFLWFVLFMNKEEEIVKRVLFYFFEVVRQDLEFQTKTKRRMFY